MRSSKTGKIKLAGITTVVLMVFFPVFSQQNENGQEVIQPVNKESERVREEIFNEIMGTISSEKKQLLDSASRVSSPHKGEEVKDNSRGSSVGEETLKQKREKVEGSLKQLPEDVRKRVEKAISEIEARNEQRRIELKEFREKNR